MFDPRPEIRIAIFFFWIGQISTSRLPLTTSNRVTLFATIAQMRFDRLGITRGANDHHPDAHIERAIHLAVRDVPEPTQQLEQRRYGP